MRPGRVVLLALLGIIVLAVLAALFLPEARGAVHPQASQQPTIRGKTIHDLALFDGKLYSGYGDYGPNTGPIALNPLNPATGSFLGVELLARTDAIEALRVLNGDLYVPYTDPKGLSAGTPDYAVNGTEVNKFASAHVFDMASAAGSLWAVGSHSSTSDGVVWRSQDGGATWEESLVIPPPRGDPNNFVRFYFIGVLDGKVYVQPTSYYYSRLRAWVWAGEWRRARPLGVMPWHGTEFAGQLVYQADPSCCLVTLDGPVRNAEDYTIRNGRLYVLDGEGVYATPNLIDWDLVANVPFVASSIEVVQGDVWYGTMNAEIKQAP